MLRENAKKLGGFLAQLVGAKKTERDGIVTY